MIIFEKEYDGESLYDLGRDLGDAFDPVFNPCVSRIPMDKHGIQKGRFIVTIEWQDDEEN